MTNNSSIYLFIDAGYLRKVMADKLHRFIGTSLDIKWESILRHFGAKRTFYYDCVEEDQRPGELDQDFRKRIKQQDDMLDSINSIGGYFVRLGTLRGAAGRKRQKEVDVLLAVDMLTHSHNRNMDRAILIAGDLDFKPVVEALVQQGTQVTVVSDFRSASRDMARSADQHESLTLHKLWNLSIGPWDAATAGLFPSQFAHNAFPKSSPVATGLFEGKDVKLFFEDPHWKIVLPATLKTMMNVHWHHHDRLVLEKFIVEDFGPIEWR